MSTDDLESAEKVIRIHKLNDSTVAIKVSSKNMENVDISIEVEKMGIRLQELESQINSKMNGLEAESNPRTDRLEAKLNSRIDGLETRFENLKKSHERQHELMLTIVNLSVFSVGLSILIPSILIVYKM